jgi:hypothetical protein
MSLLPADITGAGATIDGAYRYDLHRTWGDTSRNGVVCFVMLNPSTADGLQDDPTIRRCIGFAKSWGHAGLVVVNLYAYRSTDPRKLPPSAEAVGPRNDEFIRRWASESRAVVCAWGSAPFARKRAIRVLEIIRSAGANPVAIRLTKGGCPAHPLYLPANLGHIAM